MLWGVLFFGVFIASSTVVLSIEHESLRYHSSEAQQQNLPVIKLPYGSWQASKYDSLNDIYTFSNIRFAAAPVGKLRFARPVPPAPNNTLQDGSYGGSCPQTFSLGLIQGVFDTLIGSSGLLGFLSSTLSSLLGLSIGSGAVDLAALMGGQPSQEDCLFLDVYVPGRALKGHVKLPVVSWLYGGSFFMGTKDLYNGTPLIKASGGNIIWVSGNYRIGALGFLGGATAEKSNATNVGLHDQRAILQWIKDHIHLVGGDSTDISLWGESAGGGSILYHLVAYGGKEPALFTKALIQSPAGRPHFDRRGLAEEHFRTFARYAGCDQKGIECLRDLDYKVLKAAQDRFVNEAPAGMLRFGPAADGQLIRQAPALELASGNYIKNLQSLIVSHVKDEGTMFAEGIKDSKAFDDAVKSTYGSSEIIRNAILEKFPTPQSNAKFKTEQDRYAAYMQSSTFNCGVRFITEAYKGKTYNMQYSLGTGIHGSDMLPTFMIGMWDSAFATFATQYVSYLVSHARTADPNKFRINGSIEWPHVTIAPTLSNVLDAGTNGFTLIEDEFTKEEECGMWRDILAALTSAKGLAPPGAVVNQSSFSIGKTGDPSANYQWHNE